MLVRLGIALFLALAAFHICGPTLPLYFLGLGFDPPLIGLLIGVAGVAELAGALVVGPGIDRFGGKTVLISGAVCFLTASLGYTQLSSVPALTALRLLQGLGLAAVLPSAYSYVPMLVKSKAQTLAFATLGTAGSVAIAIVAPVGIALLQQSGPDAVFLLSAAMAAMALAVVASMAGPTPGGRRFSLTFRRVWLMPLLVAVLSVIQWGVLQAFVPIEASAADANPAIFFTTDSILVLASRIPAGWMADRYGPFRQALIGVLLMALSPVVLLLPLSNTVLVAGGMFNGLGAGLTLPPMLAQLSMRSDDAIGMIVGASGGGLLYPFVGFHGLLIIGAALCVGGIAVLVSDKQARVSSAVADPVRREARHPAD